MPGSVGHVAEIASGTAQSAAARRSYTVTLTGLQGLKASRSRLPRVRAGTILLANSTTTVSCGKRTAGAEALLGRSKFRVIFTPRCRHALKVKFARGKRGLAEMIHSRASATVTLLGNGKLAVTMHRVTAGKAAIKLILTRSGAKVTRKLKAKASTTVHVKAGSYQLQIVVRTGHTALVGTIPLRVT